jgi:hypothetical protein
VVGRRNLLSNQVNRIARASLLLVPGLLLLGWCWLSRMKPYSTNPDPSYAYLLNSLLMAEFKAPYHADHPGTTLQMLGAVAIRAATLFSNREAMIRDVVQYPEFYLGVIHLVVLGVVSAAVFAAGYLVLRATGDLVAALLLQITPFVITPWITDMMLVVNTQPLLIGTGILLSGLLICLSSNSDQSSASAKLGPALGILVGFGVATKIIFAPVGLVPFFVIRGWKTKLFYIAVVCLATLAFVSPALSRLKHMIWWFQGMATHSGAYGRGNPGFIDPQTYLPNLGNLIKDNIFFATTILGSALFVFWRWVHHRKFELLLAVVTGIELLQLLLVAKMPKNSYLVPAFSLAGLNFVLAYRILRGSRVLFSIVLIVFCGLALADFKGQARAISLANDTRKNLAKSIAEVTKNQLVIHYWGSTADVACMQFGNDFSNFRYGVEIAKHYPPAFFYALWSKRYATFTQKKAPPPTNYAAVFFRGAPFSYRDLGKSKPPGFTFEDKLQGKKETVYLAIPSGRESKLDH